MKSSCADAPAYITRDGSEIRELMHPSRHGNRMQSLAEATVQPGTRTRLHRHALTEELYHISAGSGLMTLGETCFKVGADEAPALQGGRARNALLAVADGDTVLIAPGTPHRMAATGEEPLRILCCCSPPYSHEDTELLEET